MNIFKKLYTNVITKYRHYTDNRLMNKLLDGVSKDDEPFIAPVLKNELTFLNSFQSPQKTERSQKEFLMAITKNVAEQLLVLKKIVGVQPMQGPVGLVYRLQFSGQIDSSDWRLEVVSAPVMANTRQLQAGWSVEAAQDVQSIGGIDVTAELQTAISREVTESLVSEVVHDLQRIGSKSTNNQPSPVTSRAGVIFALQRAANSIAASTRRGAGNFIITSPIGIALLQSDKNITFVDHTPSTQPIELSSMVLAGHIMVSGEILYPVYVSLAVTEEAPSQTTFIVGYKGGSEIDTGYIYSPYVPVMPTGPVVDPNTFEPLYKLMTRYGKTTCAASEDRPIDSSCYYRTVTYDASAEAIEETHD